MDDEFSTLPGEPIYLDLIANDSDADGDPLEVDPGSTALGGTLVDQKDGGVVYIPPPGVSDVSDSFGYTLIAGGQSATATVTVRIGTAAEGGELAPGDLRATPSTAPVEVRLDWTDRSDGEEGFRVYRREVGLETFQLIAELAPDTVSYVDADEALVVGRTYDYQVEAFHSGGAEASNIATATLGDASTFGIPMAVIGKFTVDSGWTWVSFPATLQDPVVFALPAGRDFPQPAVVRVDSVSSNGFFARLVEPLWTGDGHPPEEVHYLAVEAGRWSLGNGAELEANRISTSKSLNTSIFEASSNASEYSFTESMSAALPGTATGSFGPLLTQVQTTENVAYLKARHLWGDVDWFHLTLEIDESKNGPYPNRETIGWLAMSPGQGIWPAEGGSRPYVARDEECPSNVNGVCVVSYSSTSFGNKPLVAAWLSTIRNYTNELPEDQLLQQLRRDAAGSTDDYALFEYVADEPNGSGATQPGPGDETISLIAVEPPLGQESVVLYGGPINRAPRALDIEVEFRLGELETFAYQVEDFEWDKFDLSTFPVIVDPIEPVNGASEGELRKITPISSLYIQFEFTPPTADWTGTSQWRYRVSDAGGIDGENPMLSDWATVTVKVVEDNPPVAQFSRDCGISTCSFDASGSTDDHSISSYEWVILKGVSVVAEATGSTFFHSFDGSGDFQVALTVTDDRGQQDTQTQTVRVDHPPVASFTVDCTDAACSFTSQSTDDLGISSHTWSFGDGTSATGAAPTHQFPGSGNYDVTLTVVDSGNHTDTRTRSVTVDLLPVPLIAEPVCTDLDCTFDASASSDDHGIVTHNWDFGDGTLASGAVVEHRFRDEGLQTVTLEVVDTVGQRSTATTSVEVEDLTTLLLIILGD